MSKRRLRRARASISARRRRELAKIRNQQHAHSLYPEQLLALEPRIVFDAAIAASADHVADQVAEQQAADIIANNASAQVHPEDLSQVFSADELNQAVSGVTASSANEIVFIDAGVENANELLAAIDPSAEIIFLDSDRDGVEQIAEVMAGRNDVDAIHILSHGTAGQLQLGNATLDTSTIAGDHADELATIGSALSVTADILIYGCDFGADAEAVKALGIATGADITASTDTTGAASLGGDWELEVSTGHIEAIGLSPTAWVHTLDLTITGVGVAGGAGGVTGANVDALANQILGDGVTINSATYYGGALQAATFTTGAGASFGTNVLAFDSGAIFSSGTAASVTGPNSNTGYTVDAPGIDNDPQFNALAGGSTRDASYITISFTPDVPPGASVGDTARMTMQIVFGSDEYNEYVYGSVNDTMAVIVNGQNQAIVPNGLAIGIDTINAAGTYTPTFGSPSLDPNPEHVGAGFESANPSLYVNNASGTFNTQMDGFTITVPVTFDVIVGQVNTITIGIADTADPLLDSWMFVKADSGSTVIVAENDSVSTPANVPHTIDVTANDYDLQGDPLTVTHINDQLVNTGDIITLASGATVTVGTGGSLTVAGDGVNPTTDAFTYQITDGNGGSSIAFVNVAMTAPVLNTAPVAIDDGPVTVIPGVATNIDVINGPGADSDADGDSLTISGIIDPADPGNPITLTIGTEYILASGTKVTLNPDKTFTVIVPPGISPVETFDYIISDGNGGSAVATVTVHPDHDRDEVADVYDLDDDNDGLIDSVDNQGHAAEDSLIVFILDTSGSISPSEYAQFQASITATANAILAINPHAQFAVVQYGGGNALSSHTAHITLPFQNAVPVFSRDITLGIQDHLPASLADVHNFWEAGGPLDLTTGTNNSFIVFTDAGEAFPGWTVLNDAPSVNDIDALDGYGEYDYLKSTYDARIIINHVQPGIVPQSVLDNIASEDNSGTELGFQTSFTLSSAQINQIAIAAVGPETIAQDSDGDGLLNSLDLDSDDDGITDNIEAQSTAGYIAPSGLPGTGFTDIDGDGLDDIYDANTSDTSAAASIGLTPVNTDGTDNLDYIETDSDNDGLSDITENGLGVTSVNPTDSDTDRDGLKDVFEAIIDGNINDGYVVSEGVTDPLTAQVNQSGYLPDGGDAIIGSIAPLTADLDYRDVTADNFPPVGVNDTIPVTEDTPVTQNILGNDTDIDGDPLTITAASIDINGDGIPDPLPLATPTALVDDLGGPIGTITVQPNGDVTFAPAPNYIGAVPSLTYTPHDGTIDGSPATVNFGPITPVNDAPIALTDTNADSEQATLIGNLIDGTLTTGSGTGGIDTDIDGDTLTVTGLSIGTVGSPITLTYGKLTIQTDGSYTFVPNATANALDLGEIVSHQITYTVSDSNGGTSDATLTLTLTGENDAPFNALAIPAATATDGGSVSIPTFNAFNDADGEPLEFSLAPDAPAWLTIDPTTGLITNNAPVPADASIGGPASNGVYTIGVIGTDPHGALSQVTAQLTVANLPPIATNDTNSVSEDETDVSGNVLTDLAGADTDTAPDSDTLVVVAANQSGTPITIGTPVTLTGGGTLTLSGDGSYTFEPGIAYQHLAASETALEIITYSISDGNGGTDTATLTLTVTGLNDAPIAVDPSQPPIDPANPPTGVPFDPDSPFTPPVDPTDYVPHQAAHDSAAITPLDLTPYFGDPDATDATVLSIDPADLPTGLTFDPATGILSGTPDHSASQGGDDPIAAPGVYTIPVTATDPSGATVTTNLIFTISNPAPVANDDGILKTADDGSDLLITALDNDIDPDGDSTYIAAVNGQNIVPGGNGIIVQGGSVSLAADGKTMIFSPQFGYEGSASFDYTMSDEDGAMDTATISLLVVSTSVPSEGIQDPETGSNSPSTLSTDNDRQPGIILDTFHNLTGLNDHSIDSKTTGIVLNALNSIDHLGGNGLLSVDSSGRDSHPVAAVLHSLRLHQLNLNAFETFSQSFTQWGAESFTGYSLRQSFSIDARSGAAPQLVIETLVRDRVIYIELNTASENGAAASNVIGYKVQQADGRPLPNWVQQAQKGALLANPPVSAPPLDLRIVALLSDGSSVEKRVTIDTSSGEIQSMTDATYEAPPKFEQQLLETEKGALQ